MNRFRQKLFFTVGLPQMLIEVGLLGALLFSVLPQTIEQPPSDELTPETLILTICCGFWGAARLRWGARTLVNYGSVVMVGAAVCVGILPAILLLGKWPGIIEDAFALVNLFIILFITNFVFINFRVTFFLWRGWNRLRRQRLLWSFTHTQIIIILSAALVGLVGLAVNTLIQNSQQGEPFNGLRVLLFDVGIQVLPLFVATAVGTLALAFFFALPLVFISYLLTRGTIGRLEDLVKGTTALRTGNLSARVAVSGEDEVAQLQENFNNMAADLERAVTDLEQERDRVAGLLRVQHELTAAVSHELRTPIATIQGYLQPIMARTAEISDPTIHHDLKIINRETARLQKLIDDLFALSRAEVDQLTLDIQPIDVAAVTQRMVDVWQPLSWRQQRVEVIHQPAPGTHVALVDGRRLEQILTNLVHNAVRHTPPGGIVAVAVQSKDDGVVIAVRDTGEGIAADVLALIWEPFYRGEENAHQPDSQTGLGLALVKTMTEAMKGNVRVTSQPGEGSCFEIWLPKP